MKSVVAVLLSILWLPVSAEIAQPNTDQLVGEWVFDIDRFMRHRLDSMGVDVEAHMQKMESSFSDTKFRENLLALTITDSLLIFHENAQNPRRVQPYKIIGGNSALAIIEYLDEDDVETIAHVHIEADGISFSNPSCETYVDQCERQKARYLNRFNPGVNTRIDGGEPVTGTTSTNPLTNAQLEKDWQEQLNTRVFFRPATESRSTR